MAGEANSIINDNQVVLKEQDEHDEYEELCCELLNKLQIKLGPLEINGRTLMIATRYAMELVELTHLKGEEQKQMVIRILQRLVKDAPLSEKKEKLCLKLISSGIIGQTIDLIVDATKGNFKINNVAKFVGTSAQTLVETKCCGLF